MLRTRGPAAALVLCLISVAGHGKEPSRTFRFLRTTDHASGASAFRSLAPEWQRLSGSNFEIAASRDIAGVADLFRRAGADAVITSAARAAYLRQIGVARALAAVVESGGVEQNRTVIFVRDESEIRNFGQLQGRLVAFEDPASTAGFHMPRCELTRAGLRMREATRAAPNQTSYMFAGAKLNVAGRVFHGKADAGALGIRSWRRIVDNAPAFRGQLRILGEVARCPASSSFSARHCRRWTRRRFFKHWPNSIRLPRALRRC